MKLYETIIQETEILKSIKCDVCEKEYDDIDDILELQEFLEWENSCGYNSIFGDGNRISIDICQHCQKNLLGKYIKVKEYE